MRKTCLTLFSFFFLINIHSQTFKISGTLTDDNTGETLIGATILSGEIGTVTDFDGNYELVLPKGTHDLVFSYVGYEAVEQRIDLFQNQKIDIELSLAMLDEIVVTADIAIERRTPVAFSNIPTLKLQEELASQDIPMILNSTPGAYATQSGGGDGDARITIRGFNQRNVAVMLDGVPVNDMENGWVYWSNWFGLDLVTQTMQVQRGLGASKLSIPSVGGTINILTKGIDAKKGLKIKQEVGTGAFTRTTLGLTTGRMKNGWGVSAATSYKQGDGWVDGTFTKGYFYYLRIDKQIGDHVIGFQGFGAPQQHGQRPFTAEIAQVDSSKAVDLGVSPNLIDSLILTDKGRRYNEHWGWRYDYDGEGNRIDSTVFNTRKNYYHKPQLSLRHSWQANPKLFWSNVAYLSIGNGGGTAAESTSSFPRNDRGLLNIEKAIESNQVSLFNGNGKSNNFLFSNINNHFWYGLLSTAKYDFSEKLSLSAGIDARSYEGDHYRTVYDLLEGNFASADDFPELKVGDRYLFDNTGLVRWGGLFGLLDYSNDEFSAFLNISGARTGYAAEDYLREEKIDWINLWSKTFKAGAGYNIDSKSNVFFNIGYLDKAQRFNNVINTRSMRVFENYDNEIIKAIELGYRLKTKFISANLNAYYTIWNNKPVERPPTICSDPSADPDNCPDRVPINIPGINALHKGVELEISFEPTSKLGIEGIFSIGDWIWNSGSSGFAKLDNGLEYRFEFDATGVHVGDAAQTQLGGLIRYEPIKGLYFKAKGTYFGRNWTNFQPETLQGEFAGRDSWQLPSYFLLDFHTGYSTKLFDKWTSFRINILNMADTVYLSDGTNNDNFNQIEKVDFDAKSASVHFGQGLRWNASVQVEF